MVIPALIGGAIGLVGGALNRNSAKKQRSAGEAHDMQMYEMQRGHFIEDRRDDRRHARHVANLITDSRGVNFQRMRDEAQAAGYNPLTALGTAGLYSTELGFAPAGSGSSAGMGPTMGSAGASRQFDPALSSGGFIAEAMGRAADTYFNTPPTTDKLADALRNAMNTNTAVSQAVDQTYNRNFGFDIATVEPYRPVQRSGAPALAAASDAAMPAGEIETGGRKFVPVQLPDGSFGQLEKSIAGRLDIEPFDTISAGDWAEIVGEIGEAETAIFNQKVRKTALGRGLFGGVSGPVLPPHNSSLPKGTFNPYAR